jgi:transposase
MWIIGVDYHPRFQQIAFVNTDTGECGEQRLGHREEAEHFYRALAGQAVQVGMEATGHTRWFERFLAEVGHELWVGDPTAVRAAAPRKQKTDMRDAKLLLQLLMERRFPRIWVPTPEERDLRQLVLHRHRLVQIRTRVKNQLRAVALSEGMMSKGKPWLGEGLKQLQALPLPAWTARRRQDNLDMLDELVGRTRPLDQAVAEQAEQRPNVALAQIGL